jgi:trans-2,3-dihydro-3-hydroxyanthranilate isomerase
LGRHPLTWLDVFADGPLRGNQLAVVHDADGLDEETMLAFARETKLSETTFVQTATAPGADYRNRIFDPRQELRFAGHPSLGTAVAIARARGERQASYVQQTTAGLQPIDVALDADGRARASMLQEPPTFGPELDAGEILGHAGLDPGDADPELPAQVVGTGVPQVLAPVRPEALGRAAPDYARIEVLLDRFDAIVLYLAACDPASGRARARAFGHTAAMGEDPGTGSAAGPLMAHLHARTGIEALEIDQGVEMGRPSRLSCAMEGHRPRVGGSAAIVIEGSVNL